MSGLGHETFASTSDAMNPSPAAFGRDTDGSSSEGHRKAQNISQTERWGSVIGGAALMVAGLRRGGISGLVVGLAGGSLFYRGFSGHCQCYEALGIDTAERPQATAVRAGHGVKVEKTITIDRPPAELYRFWRELENLPKIMRHLERVEKIDERRSRWTARGPMATELHWEAEIINEKEPELIAWRSLPGSQVDTAGSIHFKSADEGRHTSVVVSLKYDPPAGRVGDRVASFLGGGLEQKLAEDLERFKSVMESGGALAHDSRTP